MDDAADPKLPYIQTDELFQFPPALWYTYSQQPPPPLYHHPLISTSPPNEYRHGIALAANDQLSNSTQPGIIFHDNYNHGSDNQTGDKKKKISHSDIEKQRRKEMAALYGSLRSQLPLEYLKGKRSAADQMHEAVKYVKHLQKKIKELKAKRDELKRRSCPSDDQSNSPIIHECATGPVQEDAVMVSLYRSGEVEVAVNTCVDQGLPLGRVLEILIEEGLSINGCNSTRVNERLLHFIQCEIIDAGRIDIANDLQQKIKDLKA
ncbi:transcription factor bHLH126-like [Punica granatum]|uniref:Transcription factor bHLH126-like n=2 Tax=Punica granatum TaxID=22663 RepID=A0A6P8DGT7_PUNGR|nr:transcription factor bHLH126-like [Punica granatum]PKI53371.1 hypothetical protein CRG98_026250 [Punica granatum]